MRIAKMYPLLLGMLVAAAACGEPNNNALGEHRPDGAAVSRAAEVTNTSDNKEPRADRQDASAATGTPGATGNPATSGQSAAETSANQATGDAGTTVKVQAKFTANNVE